MRKFLPFSIGMTSLLVSLTCVGQTNQSGGESGFDASLEAIEPVSQKVSLSLAGESPVDISRFILAGNQGVSNVRISPNGNTLAFIWSITGVRQLWLMPSVGGQPKQMTFGNGVRTYRWSPDGDSLFYSADNNGDEQEAYYAISVDGLKETELLPASKGGFRRFGDFIDADTITYASTERNKLDFDIYTANIRTQEVEQVFQGTYGFYVVSASPDGKYLALAETVGEDSDNLYLLDLNTRDLLTVSKPERRANHTNAGITWLPDSSGFYLASNVDRDFSSVMKYSLVDGFSDVYSGSGDIERVLLCGDKNQYLVWVENLGGYSKFGGVDPKTGKQLSFPRLPEGVYRPHCQQGSNKLAIAMSNYQSPSDIYVVDLASQKATQSFAANLAGINKDTLVNAEPISLKARDGVTIHGLLYMPKVKSEGKPPVLFRVHGGPTAQSRPSFSASTQYLLGKGIAVFYPNVRGSTGYGHTYVTLDDRENRLDSVRDLVDMLDYLKQDGRVDTSKAIVSGGSYGGYAVNAVLANYPGHFIAGVSLFGVADWVTALQVASPGLKASDRIEYGDITEQKWLDFYTKQSPIRQADNITVPVLYSHGVKDPRIDIAETEVMVKTLRKNGIDTPYIRMPDEGHGWRKLSNQLFYYRQEAAFLEKHMFGTQAD